MSDSKEERAYYIKLVLLHLYKVEVGKVYWMYIRQKQDTVFNRKLLAHTTIPCAASSSTLHCNVPLTLKLKKDKSNHWKSNRLVITVYEGDCADPTDTNCYALNWELPELYEGCAGGEANMRQFVRNHMYLTFTCSRVEPGNAILTQNNTVISNTSTTSPKSVKKTDSTHNAGAGIASVTQAGSTTKEEKARFRHQMYEMFPSLTKEYINGVILTMARQQDVVEYLLTQTSQSPEKPIYKSRDGTRKHSPNHKEKHHKHTTSTKEESDMVIAQKMQEYENLKGDADTNTPTQSPPSIPTTTTTTNTATKEIDYANEENCTAVLNALPDADPSDVIQALEVVEGEVDLAINLLVMQGLDKPTPVVSAKPEIVALDNEIQLPDDLLEDTVPSPDAKQPIPSSPPQSSPRAPQSPPPPVIDENPTESCYGLQCFKYADLKLPGSKLGAPEIDPSKREQYLSSSEFQKVFQMTKDQFEQQPKWKQTSKKKELGLF